MCGGLIRVYVMVSEVRVIDLRVIAMHVVVLCCVIVVVWGRGLDRTCAITAQMRAEAEDIMPPAFVDCLRNIERPFFTPMSLLPHLRSQPLRAGGAGTHLPAGHGPL